MKLKQRFMKGVSLVEMMITLTILGIIMAIGFPMYEDYIATARIGAMVENMESLRAFQENIRISDGAYVEGSYDPDDPDNASGLKTLLGWSPRTTDDPITYVVSEAARTTFKITATDNTGVSVCMEYSRNSKQECD